MTPEQLQKIKSRHMGTEWFGIPPVEESLDAHCDREVLLEEVDRLRSELIAARLSADEGWEAYDTLVEMNKKENA